MRIAQMNKNRIFHPQSKENALTQKNGNADLGNFFGLPAGT